MDPNRTLTHDLDVALGLAHVVGGVTRVPSPIRRHLIRDHQQILPPAVPHGHALVAGLTDKHVQSLAVLVPGTSINVT